MGKIVNAAERVEQSITDIRYTIIGFRQSLQRPQYATQADIRQLEERLDELEQKIDGGLAGNITIEAGDSIESDEEDVFATVNDTAPFQGEEDSIQDVAGKGIPCPHCEFTAKNTGRINRHLNQEHNGGPRPRKCRICNKVFDTTKALGVHISNAHDIPENTSSGASFYHGEVLEDDFDDFEDTVKCEFCGERYHKLGIPQHEKHCDGETESSRTPTKKECRFCGEDFPSKGVLAHEKRCDERKGAEIPELYDKDDVKEAMKNGEWRTTREIVSEALDKPSDELRSRDLQRFRNLKKSGKNELADLIESREHPEGGTSKQYRIKPESEFVERHESNVGVGKGSVCGDCGSAFPNQRQLENHRERRH